MAVRPVYLLPNLITSASLFSGLTSVMMASQERYPLACWLILLSAVLDGLDGPVARWTRTTSSFGLQFDSLSDLVAFGVAPSFLMYKKLESIDMSAELPWYAPRMAIGMCALFVICGAIRLARFNIQVGSEEKLHFTGMPIPSAAGTVVTAFLVIDTYLSLPETRGLHRLILILMVLVSYLMVSTHPFPSPKALLRRTRRSMEALVTVLFVVAVGISFHQYAPFFLFVGFLGYIFYAMLHGKSVARGSASKTMVMREKKT